MTVPNLNLFFGMNDKIVFSTMQMKATCLGYLQSEQSASAL
jgi:hypothetical protein